MRLTIRCILYSLRAIESAIDEVCNRLRQTKYDPAIVSARIACSAARKDLSALLDQMIDDGFGDDV